MYLLIFTDFYDYYKDRGNTKSYYELFVTQEKAEFRAIDLLYTYINQYLIDYEMDLEMDLEMLQERGAYSMHNRNELLSIIQTEYVEYKYNFKITQIEIQPE